MLLCLDIGNSQIFGGVFKGKTLKITFRHNSTHAFSSDQFGIFLISLLKENHVKPDSIKDILVASVVPSLDYTIRAAFIKYLKKEPKFVNPEKEVGLKVLYRNPSELGADRLANAVAAVKAYPKKNLLVVDCGTATTLLVISHKKEFIGGVIFPGMKVAMDSLHLQTAKLSSVEIITPSSMIGQTTAESIQIGLFHTHLSTIQAFKIATIQHFKDEPLVTIGTGGFANLFNDQHIFDHLKPNLVLEGLAIMSQFYGCQ